MQVFSISHVSLHSQGTFTQYHFDDLTILRKKTQEYNLFPRVLTAQMFLWKSVKSTVLTLSHVLRDDVDRFLWHHGVELNQLFVSQLLHDLSLLEEGLRRHGAGLQSLYRHTRRTVPCSWWKIAKWVSHVRKRLRSPDIPNRGCTNRNNLNSLIGWKIL